MFQFVEYESNAGQFAGASCGDVIVSPDGGDIDFEGCTMGSAATPITSPGLLAILRIAPVGSGCSLIHFVTEGAPDFDSHSSFTFADADTKHLNQFADRPLNAAGGTCAPPPLPTPTAVMTLTPTPTATATPTPSSTPFPDSDIDGFTDALEIVEGSDPSSSVSTPDPDMDGLLNSIDDNDDNDACTDVQELGTDENLGGDRDPLDFWDFYDVTGEGWIDLSDALAILASFGVEPGAEGYDPRLDRYAPNPLKPWRTAAAIDSFGIDLTDALANLDSFGHECVAPT